MTASLPPELLSVFERSRTTEYVTVDHRGQPVVWPVTPSFHAGKGCIDVTTGPHDPDAALADPRVALLFSDATGSGLANPPMVLVQGTAQAGDREVHVRPERVYAWPHGDPEIEPELFDAHLEEVRSGHNEEPEEGHAPPEGGPTSWDERLEHLGTDLRTAALAFVGPDGFPFAVRVPVRADPGARVVRLEANPLGAPFEPGPACLWAHAHPPDVALADGLQVRGDLAEHDGRWVLEPHRVVGGAGAFAS